jgi:hypothetical protein
MAPPIFTISTARQKFGLEDAAKKLRDIESDSARPPSDFKERCGIRSSLHSEGK